MATYDYKAKSKIGKLIQGTLEGQSEGDARRQLEKLGHTPISIKKSSQQRKPLRVGRQRIKFSELNMFTRLLFTLQTAGLPILRSLDAIASQSGSASLSAVVGEISKRVESGSKLSEAFEVFPLIFNKIYVNMIKAGEVSGRLPEILERLAVLGEHDEKIQRSIKSAMRYPLIVVSVLVFGFIALILFVVPKFTDLFSSFETTLPLPTRILLLIYTIIVSYWWLAIIVVGVGSFAGHKFVQTEVGRWHWDKLRLNLPVFGDLVSKVSLSRFCRITATLLVSGVPILQILELTRDGAGNVVISKTIDKIKNSVNEGKGMLEPMKASGLFPPVVTQMVSVGEETGKLDELLTHVADYYDAQVEYTISNLVSLIEPMLIIFLGGAVLFIALGIFMPMWSLMSLFK